jgi:hypothetical protein
MIPAAIFLNRYDQPTIDKAASLLATFCPTHNDDLMIWKKVLAWVCEHAGGMDRSKAVTQEDNLAARLREIGGFEKWETVHPEDKVILEGADCIESLSAEISKLQFENEALRLGKDHAEQRRVDEATAPLRAELTELRAQMLSDQGQHEGETGRLRGALLDLDEMIFLDEQVIESAAQFRARIAHALEAKKFLTTAPAETPRTCETCHHEVLPIPCELEDVCIPNAFSRWTPKPIPSTTDKGDRS